MYNNYLNSFGKGTADTNTYFDIMEINTQKTKPEIEMFKEQVDEYININNNMNSEYKKEYVDYIKYKILKDDFIIISPTEFMQIIEELDTRAKNQINIKGEM